MKKVAWLSLFVVAINALPASADYADNHIIEPVVHRRAPVSQNPQGSLNFSTPVTAKGPFTMGGAQQLYRQQNWNGLLNYSRGWSAAEPNSSGAWFCLGEAAIHLGNYDAAVEGFRRATLATPKEPKPWNNLSAAYCKRQQWDLALKAIRDGESASSGMCTATDWYVFGNARKELKDYDGAIADYRRALAKRPNFPEATNNLGACQYALGDTASASANYNRAARLGDGVARVNQAGIAAEQDAARRQAQVQSDPNNVWNWAQKSLNAQRNEVNSRREMNGDIRPRQY